MKLTFDLPADLVERLKLKAAQEGSDMKDLIVQACRKFLGKEKKNSDQDPATDPFPLFKGGKQAQVGMELTPERVDEILWGKGIDAVSPGYQHLDRIGASRAYSSRSRIGLV